ncbi:MAG: hypothetical protein H0V37_05755 [Chloroflexia bacterium]|nr:hypothetical protein [Chloroflexia bacterium]
MTVDPVAQILEDPRFQGQPLTWEVTPDECTAIRHAWLTHVSTEERLFVPHSDDEWRRHMATMLSVFSDECVMELVFTGERWDGKVGAEEFYRVFTDAFEGMTWVPQALAIGPQGVLDVANMTGVLRQPFAGLTGIDQPVHLQWVIHFPWLPDEGKFRGETVHSIRPLTPVELAAVSPQATGR